MAYATTVTIGAGRKVSVNYNSQEVNLTVCYQLERSDTDLLAFVQDKVAEVEQAHQTAWRRLHDQRTPPRPEVQKPDTKRPATPPGVNGVAAVPEDNGLSGEERRIENTFQIGGPVNNGNGSPGDEAVTARQREELSTPPQQRAIAALAEKLGMTDKELENLLTARFGWATTEELTKPQAGSILDELQRKARTRQKANGHL